MKLRRELTPHEYAALKQADAQYREDLARGMALARRDANEAVRRVRQVEASSIDAYFSAVICYCVEAGVDLLRTLYGEAWLADSDLAMESPPKELRKFIAVYENDREWSRALDVAVWAYVSCFVAANYPDEFDARLSVAFAVLGSPDETEQRVIDAARSLDGSEHGMSGFLRKSLECAHRRTVGPLPTSSDVLDYALVPWQAGWDTGFETLNGRLDDYIARGG